MSDELRELSSVARLLGLLLLREVDSNTLDRLTAPDVEAALGSVGITLPPADTLDELAAEYFEYFVNPEKGIPLVQSIREGGTYEGDSARGVRAIAEAAGLELNQEHLRGAPIDHFAVELFLWSELVGRDVAAGEEFARRHLVWAREPLRRQKRRGFYGTVCRVAADFLDVISSPAAAAP